MINATASIALNKAGLVEYEQALQLQRELHNEVAEAQRPNTLLLLQHPPVFTAGRRTLESEKPTDGSTVIDVDRGGKITFHGPGQIVGYPIVKLKNPNDVVGFVRELETSLIEVCKEYGNIRLGRAVCWSRQICCRCIVTGKQIGRASCRERG